MQRAFQFSKLTDHQREVIQQCLSIFASAKKAVTVKTACHIMLVLKGADQKSQAEKILLKQAELPKSLVPELQNAAEQQTDRPQLRKRKASLALQLE